MELLAGKTVLITGAAQGLGAAIAASCIRHGGTVVLTDVLADELEETVRELGPSASARQLDVTDPTAWKRLVDEFERHLGRPDALVNNAGVISSMPLAD